MRLHGRRNIALRGGHDLHRRTGELLDFFNQEEVGGLGEGNGEHAVDQEHGENGMLFEKIARENLDDAGVADLGRNLGVGNAVHFGQGFAELFFGDEALFHEDFAQQAMAAGGLLVFQPGVERRLGDQALVEQDLADGLSFGGGGDHGTLVSG